MRAANLTRTTKETNITLRINLDQAGANEIGTGIGFFDHMLTALAVHGGFTLAVKASGDLQVDGHHTVEDVGIVLGQAFAAALGDKGGIARYGSFTVPMDEALAVCNLDISGRPFLVFDIPLKNEKVGQFDTCLAEEFFRAFAFHAGITLHIGVPYGKNDHHMIEAAFKAAGHALAMAVRPTGAVLSTKGSLD